jgi:hypothetical protein
MHVVSLSEPKRMHRNLLLCFPDDVMDESQPLQEQDSIDQKEPIFGEPTGYEKTISLWIAIGEK